MSDQQAQFKAWLQTSQGTSPKTATDACGRVKRAERILGEPLETMLANGVTATVIVERLKERVAQSEAAFDRAERVVSDLRRAVERYLEFQREA
jgi:hypothetical protein